MKKSVYILMGVFISFLLIPNIHTMIQEKTLRHNNKKFVFESGHFKVIGELCP